MKLKPSSRLRSQHKQHTEQDGRHKGVRHRHRSSHSGALGCSDVGRLRAVVTAHELSGVGGHGRQHLCDVLCKGCFLLNWQYDSAVQHVARQRHGIHMEDSTIAGESCAGDRDGKACLQLLLLTVHQHDGTCRKKGGKMDVASTVHSPSIAELQEAMCMQGLTACYRAFIHPDKGQNSNFMNATQKTHALLS